MSSMRLRADSDYTNELSTSIKSRGSEPYSCQFHVTAECSFTASLSSVRVLSLFSCFYWTGIHAQVSSGVGGTHIRTPGTEIPGQAKNVATRIRQIHANHPPGTALYFVISAGFLDMIKIQILTNPTPFSLIPSGREHYRFDGLFFTRTRLPPPKKKKARTTKLLAHHQNELTRIPYSPIALPKRPDPGNPPCRVDSRGQARWDKAYPCYTSPIFFLLTAPHPPRLFHQIESKVRYRKTTEIEKPFHPSNLPNMEGSSSVPKGKNKDPFPTHPLSFSLFQYARPPVIAWRKRSQSRLSNHHPPRPRDGRSSTWVHRRMLPLVTSFEKKEKNRTPPQNTISAISPRMLCTISRFRQQAADPV